MLNIAKCYQDVISKCFESVEPYSYICCDLQQPEGYWDGDGIFAIEVRLQFPYCKIESQINNRAIIPNVITLLEDRQVLDTMENKPIGGWSDIIMMNNITPMYMSTDVQNKPPLILDTIHGRIGDNHIETGKNPSVELITAFNPGLHTGCQADLISGDIFADYQDIANLDDDEKENLEDKLEYWLQLF